MSPKEAFVPKVENDLKKVILADDSFVLIQFSATWCGPCKAMTPHVSETIKKTKAAMKWVYIDIDEHDDIATRFKVKTVPLFLWFYNNEKLGQMVGADRDQFDQTHQNAIETVMEHRIRSAI